MRVYLRVEKMTELPPELEGRMCHVKLVCGAVIMRTRSARCKDHVVTFVDLESRQFNEVFVLYAKSVTALSKMHVKLQLRQDRFVLRSKRIGVATCALAMVDTQRLLFGVVPILDARDAKANIENAGFEVTEGTKKFGKITVRIEVEDEAEDSTDENKDTNLKLTDEPTPPPVEMEEVPVVSSSNIRTPVIRRTRGTQTDRLSFTAQDARNIEASLQLSERQPASTYFSSSFRADNPPPEAVLQSPRSMLPPEAQALRMTSPAFPADEREGLLLFCEHNAKYQRELERSLAMFHLDRLKVRAKALGRSTLSPSRRGAESPSVPEGSRSQHQSPNSGLTVQELQQLL